MKINIFCRILVIAILVLFIPNVYGGEQLPEGWRYPLESYFHGSCASITREHPEPFHISSDFNDDGFIDHAWILIRKDVTGWGLIIFLGKKDGAYEVIQLDDQSGNSNPLAMGLSLVGPGEYKTACGKGYWPCKPGEPEVLKLKNSAINYITFGSAGSFFFWNKGSQQFDRIWMSD